MLHDSFSDVLFCPTKDMYYKQRGKDDTVVVQKLIPEASIREFMRVRFRSIELMLQTCQKYLQIRRDT